jgi:hypothetical protein
MRSMTIVRAGGISLIAAALAFIGVFTYLAIRFDYPAVLDGSATEVLPKLLATGTTGRGVWALYGFLPLLFVPAGVAAYFALRDVRGGSMLAALALAMFAALSMMLGLLRWPSIHWALARAHESGGAAEQTAIAAVFSGLNSYLGNYLGEFLGELCLSLFFLLSSLAMLAAAGRFPRWIGYLGVFTAVAGLVGMFRNVSDLVSPVAAINNYLLPLWMIIFGVALVRDSARDPGASVSESVTSNQAPAS